MVAEFESDLMRMRTRERMQVARAKGRLRGRQPKCKPNQAKHWIELPHLGTYSQAELAELFGVGEVNDLPHPGTDPAATASH
jgi:DNA invertase Pin-like site-specific DNA recombinase